MQSDARVRAVNCIARIEMHQSFRGNRFTRSAFPDQPHHFSFVQREGDVFHRRDQPFIGTKLKGQIFDIKQRAHLFTSE